MKRRKFLTMLGVGAAAGAASGSAAAFLKGMPDDVPRETFTELATIAEAEATSASTPPVSPEQLQDVTIRCENMITGDYIVDIDSQRFRISEDERMDIEEQIRKHLRVAVKDEYERVIEDSLYGGTGILYRKQLSDRIRTEVLPMSKFRNFSA